MTYLFISTPEIVIILLVVVLLFGADKIPDIAKGLAKGMRMVRDTTNDIKQEIAKSATDTEITQTANTLQNEVKEIKENLNQLTDSVTRKS